MLSVNKITMIALHLVMTVIELLILCPRLHMQYMSPFGVPSFRTSSSVTATSDVLLIIHATSIKLFIFVTYYHYRIVMSMNIIVFPETTLMYQC